MVWSQTVIKKVKDSRGQSIVEMALVTPLLLLLLLGVVDVGRAMAVKVAVTNASREGARYGSWYPQDFAGITAACNFELALNNLNVGAATVTITPGSGSTPAASGQPIEVTVALAMVSTFGEMVGLQPIPVQTTTRMIVFGSDD